MKLFKTAMMVLSVSILGVIATGCTSVNTNDVAKAVSIDRMKVPYEVVLDCKKEKVKNEASVSVLFGFITWGESNFADDTALGDFSLFSPAGQVKAAAVYKACKASKSDVLLATKYEIKTKDYFVFKTVKCKVAGYPAKVTGVKKIK